MIVSVCPTFRCNLNCPYCYLGDMVNSSDVLSLERLTHQLNIISSHEPISEISLFGGEISLLDEDYLYKLKDICYNFTNTVGVTTNLANINITKIFDNITISLNEERDDYFEKLNSLDSYDFNFVLSIVVLPSVVSLFKSGKYISWLDNMPTKCTAITMLKYLHSIAQIRSDDFNVSDDDYEFVIQKFIEYSINHKPHFRNVNLEELKDSTYSPTMDTNIFIGSNGDFGVVAHDNNGYEYFKWLRNFDEYLTLCKEERKLYEQRCVLCEYFGNCYTQHLDFTTNCCGHKKLKRWFNDILYKIN